MWTCDLLLLSFQMRDFLVFIYDFLGRLYWAGLILKSLWYTKKHLNWNDSFKGLHENLPKSWKMICLNIIFWLFPNISKHSQQSVFKLLFEWTICCLQKKKKKSLVSIQIKIWILFLLPKHVSHKWNLTFSFKYPSFPG